MMPPLVAQCFRWLRGRSGKDGFGDGPGSAVLGLAKLVPAIISPAWSTESAYAHATLIRSTVMTQHVSVLCGRAAFLAMMLEFGHRQYSAS
jgi:hypothetical protein